MMEFTLFRTKIKVSPLFFAVLTLFLLADRNGTASVAVLFSLLHEFGHFLALLCVKTFPKLIEITVFGIHVSLPENLSTVKKCFIFAAGFSLNFLLAAMFFILKNQLFGYINLIIGIFTALPVAATDGGAFLKTILNDYFPQNERRIFKVVSVSLSVAVSVLFIFSAFATKNYFILIAVFYIIFCAMK